MAYIDKRITADNDRQKREKRRKIWGRIAAFLFITALLAGIRCASVWSGTSATGFDLFLFLYACAAFVVGSIIQLTVVYDEDDSAIPWHWWM